MRFKSKTVDNYCIYAVAGTNTVSFAIDYAKADTKGLLGFAVKRTYPDGHEYFLPGFKVFKGEKTKPGEQVSTETDPVQSFVWDDFTLDDGKEYTYTFYPMKGRPKKLEKQTPIVIKIKTEPAFTGNVHDIFFNRGVASSQAYAREFNNMPPDKLIGKKKQDAFNWLGRDLYPAIIKFIQQAKKGDTLLGAFYEFNYPDVLNAFKEAIDKGVIVKIIIDAKNNTHKAKNKIVPSTPRVANLQAIADAKIPRKNVIYREANKNLIHHNKFIVYLAGKSETPTALWTGSTNITENGIFGQTNVGHWCRNAAVIGKYQQYWEILSKDPGAKDKDTAAKKKTALAAYKRNVTALLPEITGAIPAGITPVFSPRDSAKILSKYFEQIIKSSELSVITLAFGINKELKTPLLQRGNASPIIFMMLDKADKATKKNVKTFVPLTAKNNVYESFGSYIDDTLYNWVKETNARSLTHAVNVVYLHSKFLIQDPLGDDPIVITGSANFSSASTIGNDENMIMIRGNQRAADIYYTEFNRIFNHYYFRSIVQQFHDRKVKDDDKSYFLDTNGDWLKKYKPGMLRAKRVGMFLKMKNAKII